MDGKPLTGQPSHYSRSTIGTRSCPSLDARHGYAKEDNIDEQFTQSLDQIKIDDEVLAWVVSAMGVSSAESRKQREAQAMVANKQRQLLEDNLDKMYMDKLEGIICDEEYVRLSKKFRSDLTDVKFRIEGLAEGKEVCIDNGKRLLELAQKAASLYSAQIQAENFIHCTRTPLGRVENWFLTSENTLI